MGNCSLTAVSEGQTSRSIRVFMDSGETLEFKCPKLAGDILDDHPGYRIYSRNCRSLPLSSDKTLSGGQVYYLIPQGTNPRIVHTREVNLQPKIQVSPQRRNGVWKAKVVIGSKQLEEIFGEEENTEALIEQLTMAAAASATEIKGNLSKGGLPRKITASYFC